MTRRNWTKVEGTKYSFSIDNKEIGTLEFILNSTDSKAIAKISQDEFVIRRTGFWKNGIEIVSKSGAAIAKAYYEKWYANSMILDYKEASFKLVIRNNPLVEWAIIDKNEDFLSYGLNVGNDNGMVNLKITSSETNQDYILDFILWYQLAPFATETMGDDFTLLVLLTAQ